MLYNSIRELASKIAIKDIPYTVGAIAGGAYGGYTFFNYTKNDNFIVNAGCAAIGTIYGAAAGCVVSFFWPIIIPVTILRIRDRGFNENFFTVKKYA